MAIPKPVVKEGKVVLKNRKYYVTIGRAQQEIPTGAFVSADELRKLVGQAVSVTMAGRSILALGKPPRIYCYVPAPDPFITKLIQPAFQQLLKTQYQGILGP
jgi:hypothetical protein